MTDTKKRLGHLVQAGTDGKWFSFCTEKNPEIALEPRAVTHDFFICDEWEVHSHERGWLGYAQEIIIPLPYLT